MEARMEAHMEAQLEALGAGLLDGMLQTGEHVRLVGLAAQPALNGARGRIASYLAAKGRYVVLLDGGKAKPVTVKPANLELAPAADGPRAQPVLDAHDLDELTLTERCEDGRELLHRARQQHVAHNVANVLGAACALGAQHHLATTQRSTGTPSISFHRYSGAHPFAGQLPNAALCERRGWTRSPSHSRGSCA